MSVGSDTGDASAAARPFRSWNGKDVCTATSLSAQDLTGCDLSAKSLVLRSVDLRGKRLRGVKLNGKDLSSANFSGADMTEVDLSNATVRSTQFSDADLSGATFDGAVISNARFDRADFSTSESGKSTSFGPVEVCTQWLTAGSNEEEGWGGGSWCNASYLRYPNLTSSTLFGIRSGGVSGRPKLPNGWVLKGGYFIGPGANLSGASLAGLDFGSVSLAGSSLVAANIAGAKFAASELAGVISTGLIGRPASLPDGWSVLGGRFVSGADPPKEASPILFRAPSALSNDRNAVFEFTSGGNAAFECIVDRADPLPCSSPLTLGDLADGAHQIDIVALVEGVAKGQSTHKWEVDSTPPAAPVITVWRVFPGVPLSPATKSATADLRFAAPEHGAMATCSLDGESPSLCSSPATVTGLAEGQHSFSVVFTDAAGNRSSATTTWVVDRTPPTLIADPAGAKVIRSGQTTYRLTPGPDESGIWRVEYSTAARAPANTASNVGLKTLDYSQPLVITSKVAVRWIRVYDRAANASRWYPA